MIDLNEQQRQLVKHILRRRFPERKASVFGSRAHGSSKPWSDLDVVILGEQPLDDQALAEARADFDESDLPFRVDLSAWNDLPGHIQQQVSRFGQVI